ncbi:hypothetical protein AB9P05_21775 [Roseivirga sp. BDSF3-8]|uniref:hypothetical protein n=1 Tax=Roseivirga sp. BDSF3-8 TaxID=3241598 RepID=UPI003531B3C2
MTCLRLPSFLLFLAFFLISCGDDYEPRPSNNCDDTVIIGDAAFDNASRDPLTINSLDIEGQCLKVNYTARGCDGDDWVIKLVDGALIMESLPPQRQVVVAFENNEPCRASITRETTFDLSPLQVETNSVILRIENDDSQILYEYE